MKQETHCVRSSGSFRGAAIQTPPTRQSRQKQSALQHPRRDRRPTPVAMAANSDNREAPLVSRAQSPSAPSLAARAQSQGARSFAYGVTSSSPRNKACRRSQPLSQRQSQPESATPSL